VRYFLGLFAIIALLIILIIILIPSGAKNPSKTNSLISYANTGAVVRLTIDGPEVSNQDHQEVQITVGKSNVTYAQLTGYNGQVVQVQNFANTEAAYDVFLRSLYYAGYNEGNSSSSLSDERGVCALGSVTGQRPAAALKPLAATLAKPYLYLKTKSQTIMV
jgi:hypothetical protein